MTQVNDRGDAETVGTFLAADDAVRVELGTDLTVTKATDTLVSDWDTVKYDETGAFDAGTPDRLSPLAGKKSFFANIVFEKPSAAITYSAWIKIVSSGAEIVRVQHSTPAGTSGTHTDDWGFCIGGAYNFATGDEIRLYVRHEDPANDLKLRAESAFGFSTLEGDA